MAGSASGISTLRTICSGRRAHGARRLDQALVDLADRASIRRAMKGVAAMVSGTMAAVVPIEVPAISRVNGMIATTRMMKGVERVALTSSAEHAVERRRREQFAALPLVARKTPSGRPSSVPMPAATATMSSVSQRSTCAMQADAFQATWPSTSAVESEAALRSAEHGSTSSGALRGHATTSRLPKGWPAISSIAPGEDVDVDADLGGAAGRSPARWRVAPGKVMRSTGCGRRPTARAPAACAARCRQARRRSRARRSRLVVVRAAAR